MARPSDFPKMFTDLAARVRRLEQRSPYANTGLSIPAPSTVQVDGSLIVQNGEARSGNYVAGATGWRLRPDGTIEMNDALIRGGIIGNDALTNPVRGDSALTAAYGFALTTTGATPLCSQSWTTPPGFTTAQVYITGRVYAVNDNTTGGSDGQGGDYLYARSRVLRPSSGEAGYGNGLPLHTSGFSGSQLNSSPVSIKVLNLAPGEEIRLEVQGWTSFANWPANASNVADVAGQILWTR